MSRSADGTVTHWLYANTPEGAVRGSSADHPSYGPGFRAAHERAGAIITRLSLKEVRAEYERAQERRAAQLPPVRRVPEAAPVEAAPDLPAVGAQVHSRAWGAGTVVAHLRFPAEHAWAGRSGLQVRYPSGEGVAFLEDLTAAPKAAPRPAMVPDPEPAPFLAEPSEAYQPGLFG